MALPHRSPGVDAQMPDVRGGVCRAVHRHGRFHPDRPVDPDSDAGVLCGFTGISCCQILPCPVAPQAN